MFYQHDRAPLYRTLLVTTFSQNTFHDKWFANKGLLLWPPFSPDLIVIDYPTWGR